MFFTSESISIAVLTEDDEEPLSPKHAILSTISMIISTPVALRDET